MDCDSTIGLFWGFNPHSSAELIYIEDMGRGAFLGLRYYNYTLSQKKIRQVYPVWCSRLHNHTLFIEQLCKKLGVRPNFG